MVLAPGFRMLLYLSGQCTYQPELFASFVFCMLGVGLDFQAVPISWLRYKPMIFNDGIQIPFPAPTRTWTR